MKYRKLLIISIITALLVGGAFAGDRVLKGKRHPGLLTFLHQWWVNYPASFAVDPPELTIRIDQKDLDAMEEVVRAARERGVIMPEGNEYIPAELEFQGGSFKAKIRIKGKMSDHVQGSKWSFRVVAKKDKGFLGMQRFSLQHPGTRNYLCDWFYHRVMRGEGIVALRYGFIRLKFNDEDLGVYAYEEHFGPELLANNGRLKGPLFRFDPGLFWEHRLNMLEKVRYDEAFGAYQAASVDAFGTGDLEKDPAQRALFEEAVSRMDGFRRGRLTASEVFDADRLGRRHAVLDLIGGHHSMDWSDVKFYYDPIIKRIEPVAYESFSAFPLRTLAGSNRYIGKQDPSMDLHDAYFNDPVVFRAYVRHLERISRPSYLDSTFAALAPALDSASAVIYREFPFKELDRSIYYKNQQVIRRILDVPKGFHAYRSAGVDTVRIRIVPLEGLPMEVHGLLIGNGALVPPLVPAIVPSRVPGQLGVPIEVAFVLPAAQGQPEGVPLRIAYSVLGASVRKELEVFPYDYLDGMALPTVVQPGSFDLHAFPFLAVDESAHTILLRPGAWTIATDIFIPPGYQFSAIAPLRLDLVKGARIVSRSGMDWQGSEGTPIVVGSSDHSGGGIVLLDAAGSSRFAHLRFEGFGASAVHVPAFVVQGSNARFDHCLFADVRERDLLLMVRGEATVNECNFTGGKDQLTMAYCKTSTSGTEFLGGGDDALSVKGGSIVIKQMAVEGALGSGLKLDEAAKAIISSGYIGSSKDAISVSEGSGLKMTDGKLSSIHGEALDVDAVHARHGPSSVELAHVEVGGMDVPYRIGKGNNVIVDNKPLEATATPAK